ALLILGLRRPAPIVSESAPTDGRSAFLRNEYERLGLLAPARWESDAVEALVDDLARRLWNIELENAKRQRWQYIHDERPTAVRQADATDALVAGFCRQFGILSVSDVAALHTLANAISIWQTERGRADAARAVCAATQVRFDSILRSIDGDLQPFGYAAATGYADASGSIDDLSQREQTWNDALTEEQRGNQRIAQQSQPQFDRSLDELHAFFARCELAGDDEHGLRLLLDRLPDCREAARAVERASLELERAQTVLGDAAPLALHAPFALEAELQDSRRMTERLDVIRSEIAAIEARIEQARHGNDLEAALANEQSASDALREARDAGESLAAGWTLGEFIRKQTRDVDRPRVFHRARELFARITQGRYELDVDDSDPPRFRARDTVRGTGHALDELSSGTRLQLLLAVRVAFVEQQERGPKLPLVFDETLGNSDEHRARAIIDATVQIAREGRQVLYLTAQHDEVHKWQSIMAGQPDVPFALIDLAQARGLAEWERLPPVAPQAWPLPVVPAPNGHDRDAYGELLRVPGIDLAASDPGSLHLWHLIDEPPALHRLLSMQIETWGQLRTLVAHGGLSMLDDMPGTLEHCRARADVIVAIADSWQVGRGRPIDRAVLVDSRLVSKRFMEPVVRLAQSLDGDAAALIDALRGRQLAHFHSAICNDLEHFFEEQGYIDPTPALSLDDARARVLASAAADLEAGVLTVDWVNIMVSTLWENETDSATRGIQADLAHVPVIAGLHLSRTGKSQERKG
ncbi:MAG: hypothetical protein M3439_07585, partial [Chloroflexota bacterium]|nr:hypothetical protein [Chloroflexota bacterium]